MKAVIYPPASTVQWFGQGNFSMKLLDKIVWHSTETAGGWPAYSGGTTAPTLTYDPWAHRWRQHFPLTGSARALIDSSSTAVRENRDGVVQVEISAYCDPSYGRRFGHFIADMDEQALVDLANFSVFMNKEWGIPLVKTPVWLPYPKSAGMTAARMTGPEYDAFTGHLGHQHVPGNVHGDPGVLDIDGILNRAKLILDPTGGGGGGNPEPTKGVLGMTDEVTFLRRKPQELDPARWTTLKLDDADAVTMVNGPATFDVDVIVWFDGLNAGDSVQARWVEIDYTRATKEITEVRSWSPVELIGTNGVSRTATHLAGILAKPKAGVGRRLRLQLLPNRAGVTVTRVHTQGLKESA